jgi:hypothetical protein
MDVQDLPHGYSQQGCYLNGRVLGESASAMANVSGTGQGG